MGSDPNENKENKRLKRTTKRSIDEKFEIATRICELYKSGDFTIESCCNEVGIGIRTFKDWCENSAEITDLYKKSKELHGKYRRDGIKEKATNALEKLLESYWVIETETEQIFDKNNKLTGKRVKEKKRWIQANVTAVIFSLKNTDPANWNDAQTIDTGGESQVFKIGDQVIKF